MFEIRKNSKYTKKLLFIRKKNSFRVKTQFLSMKIHKFSRPNSPISVITLKLILNLRSLISSTRTFAFKKQTYIFEGMRIQESKFITYYIHWMVLTWRTGSFALSNIFSKLNGRLNIGDCRNSTAEYKSSV